MQISTDKRHIKITMTTTLIYSFINQSVSQSTNSAIFKKDELGNASVTGLMIAGGKLRRGSCTANVPETSTRTANLQMLPGARFADWSKRRRRYHSSVNDSTVIRSG
jgi:hypothetical protein